MLPTRLLFPVLISFLIFCRAAAGAVEKPMSAVIDESFATAAEQYRGMLARIADDKERLPRTLDGDKVRLVGPRDWTSGFFPGGLWLLFEHTGDPAWKAAALDFTRRVESVKDYTGTHDLGFMLGCSFGQEWRLTRDPHAREVLIQGARSLASRFKPGAGVIRSWSWGEWKHPVIIDNMMNLELLVLASAETGDPSFREIAIRHADTTLTNHFRPDGSSFHVVDYDPDTGAVRKKQTWQGNADDSAWARGQAWGLYGFTTMARLTGDRAYLDQARKIAAFIAHHPRLPADGVPYWDFDAPGIPDTKRDASAAAVMASGLIALADLTSGDEAAGCLALAERQLRSLASPAYLAPVGANGSFLIMHGVGSFREHAEVDAPLIYADYYFLEGLARWKARSNR